MSILPRDTRASRPASHDAFRTHCAAPGCQAAADPDITVPLCRDCARQTTYEYLAATEPERRAAREASEPPDPPPRPEPVGCVYFIRLGDLVKIGFTTNLEQRMKDLPQEEVLGIVPFATMREERRCHAAFAHLRRTGEWFDDAPDLRAFITAVTTSAA